MSQDVTVSQLLSGERFFIRLSELSNDLVCTAGLDGYFRSLNATWEKVLGYPQETLLKRPFIEFVHPDDVETTRKALERLGREEDIRRFENRYRTRNGTYRWLSWRAILDPSTTQIYAIAQDVTRQKMMLETLYETERKYYAIFENAVVGIYQSRPDGQLITFNRRFAQIFGLDSVADLTKHPVTAKDLYVHPESRREFQQLLEKNGMVAGFEAEMLRKDGQKIWVSITAQKVQLTESTVYYEGIVEDITQRKKAELQLRLLSRAVEQSANAVIITDARGTIQYVNPGFCQLTGYRPEEVVGKNPRVLNSGKTPPQTFKDLWETITSGREWRGVFLNRKKDGTLFWENATISPITDEQGDITHFLAMKEDITEQRRMQEKLQNAHLDCERLLSSISAALIGLNETDRVMRWNQMAETLFGIPAEQVVGKSFLECGIQWDWIRMLECIGEIRRTRQINNWEDVPYQKPDGKKGFLSVTANPILTNTGRMVGLTLLILEVTNRRELETQLLRAQKLEAIGQLAAGIAHEINTPIQFVGDNIYFLKEAFQDIEDLLKKYEALLDSAGSALSDPAGLPALREYKEEIDLPFLLEEIPRALDLSQKGTERVAEVVRAMKEFSHPGSKSKSLIDINKTLENAIIVSRNEWKYVADVETHFSANLPQVPGLPGEINQVFLNIIVNAAHAIGEARGQDSDEKGKITITTNSDDEWVEIRIADTGKGIPLEIQSKIFDPFFTTKEVGKGTGQGLAISYNVVVQKHGGALNFESKPGKGTTFIIRLPWKSAGKTAEPE